MVKAIVSFVIIMLASVAQAAAAGLSLEVTYLRIMRDHGPTLSNLDAVPDDLGVAGATVGLEDNRTTGRFLGQTFALSVIDLPEGSTADDIVGVISGSGPVLLDAPAVMIAQIAARQPERLFFNVSAQEDDLRSAACHANLLHTIPSYAMRADAMVQFLLEKRWTKAGLMIGPRAEDQAFAASIQTAFKKFGLKSPKTVDWTFDADLRRSAAQEVPLLTQKLGEHDVLIISDEVNDFARYVTYNTWLPRPVIGATGLRPTAWDRVVEQWGAAQLQSRFVDHSGRDMRPEDYAAWAAMRALGEAMTRTKSDDVAALRAYMLSPDFALAAFKGRPLSFRDWNGQMRQPIPLVSEGAVTAQAPFEKFLHQHNSLDTLGLDRPISKCRAYQ